ncbi:DUF1501 domain-containing protein [bacterium]|jgi:hypothetical protein|nr:DUF1501 domain-containing protein [bacterium]
MPQSLPSASFGSASIGRREILRIGGLSLLGTTLPHLLEGRARAAGVSPDGVPGFGKAKRCIFLFMWGGPAQQDTWDMKPQAPAEYRGEFRPIDTVVPGIQICEHFRHMALRTNRLAIVRSVTHGDVNHTTSTHDLLTGHPYQAGNDHRHTSPNIGTVLAHLGRGEGPLPASVNMMPVFPDGDAPRFVEESMGQSAGWLGPIYDPMRMTEDASAAQFRFGYFKLHDSLDPHRLDDRRNLLRAMDRQAGWIESELSARAMGAHYERAYNLLTSRDALRSFRLEDEPAAIRDRYGMNPHGQAVLLARRLIESGVPMTTVFWPNDGIKNVSVYWDTHNRNFIDLKERLIPVSDLAFSALLDDLETRGLLDETLVVWTGEFGRTPRVGQSVVGGAGAGRDGRDHWPGVFTTVLAGAGIKGGTVYGESDKYAARPAKNAVRPADIVATIYHALGIPADTMIHDRLNRPVPLCDGKPIVEILA